MKPVGRRIFVFLRVFLGMVTVVGGTMVPLARASTVVLVRSPRPTVIAAEATVRLRGELVSAGFTVRVIDPPLDGDVRAALEKAAAGPDVEAVVAILGGGSGDAPESSAELWVIDRVTGKTVIRRVPNQPDSGRGAEVLSIRALELLRASFFEVALASGRAAQTVSTRPPVEVTRWTDAALTDAFAHRPATWGVEAGGCLYGSFEGMPPALMPLVRVQRALSERTLARTTLAGLGTLPRVSTPSGTAEIAHQFGLVEGALRFRSDKQWQPFLSVGVGALHVAAAGQTAAPYDGITRSRWSLIGDIGGGLHWTFRGRFELAWELHLQVATPYPVIRFVNEEVATEGRPTVISSLTLLAWM